MHRPKIADNATADRRFTVGNPLTGTAATRVTDDWLNDLLDNIEEVCTQGHVTFTEARRQDLADAIFSIVDIRVSQMASGGISNIAVFDAGSGTFEVPAGISRLLVEMWGAGGGGNASGLEPGSAGGGGAYLLATMAVVPGQKISYAVGAGGIGTLGPVQPSGDGGATQFGGLMVTGGQAGGKGGGPGAGGSAYLSGAGFGISGQPGDDLTSIGSQLAARGGDAPRGGGGGSAGSVEAHINGIAPGGGGGALWGSQNNWYRAGNGAPGRLVIYWGEPTKSVPVPPDPTLPLTVTQDGGNVAGTIDLQTGHFTLNAPQSTNGGTGTSAQGGISPTRVHVLTMETSYMLTATENWVVPAGVKAVLIEVCGGAATFNQDAGGSTIWSLNTARVYRSVTPGETLTLTAGRADPSSAVDYIARCGGVDTTVPGYLTSAAGADAFIVDLFPSAPPIWLGPVGQPWMRYLGPCVRILY